METYHNNLKDARSSIFLQLTFIALSVFLGLIYISQIVHISQRIELFVAISNVCISFVAHLKSLVGSIYLVFSLFRKHHICEHIRIRFIHEEATFEARESTFVRVKILRVASTKPPSQAAHCFRDSLCGAPTKR